MTSIDPWVDSITIGNDALQLTVAPDIGASILAFNYVGEGRPVHIFRETSPRIDSVFDCSMQVMLPWVNRVSGGGFVSDGVFHALELNVPGEPFPIHGNGFQSAWDTVATSETSVSLALRSDGPTPYAYNARYLLELVDAVLTARLEVTNKTPLPLPFGAGFHPWFPRTPQATLMAQADHVWLEDERYIPTRPVPVGEIPDFDFRSANRLPRRWINNSYVGWNGVAEILWPEHELRLEMSSPATVCYHVYSPSDQSPFFCFETETHIPDGVNLVSEGEIGAPTRLGRGDTLVHQAQFMVIR